MLMEVGILEKRLVVDDCRVFDDKSIPSSVEKKPDPLIIN